MREVSSPIYQCIRLRDPHSLRVGPASLRVVVFVIEAAFLLSSIRDLAPTRYKWGYNPYKWPSTWVTAVITLLIGVITPFIAGGGPSC